MSFALTAITIPTPAPYNDDAPFQQLENLAYVLLQIIQAGKTANENVSLNLSLSCDLTELIAAIQDLRFNGQEIDFGTFRIRFDGKTASIGV